MSTFLTISMVTREALRVLENNLSFTKRVARQYDDKFGVEGAKIGTVINVRKPPRYVGRTGQALQIEQSVETSVPVSLNTQAGVDLTFSSQDLALNIDDFSDRFIRPAISAIANRIDADGLALYNQIYQQVGTPGTVPNAALTYLTSKARLDEAAAPMDGMRSAVVTPMMEATLVDALKGLFQQASSIADQYARGRMGTGLGFEWFVDQNCPTHTYGTYAGSTPLVNGSNQSGASVITDGWSSGATSLKKGDTFTIAGVYAVNPQSRQSTGTLQSFVVTADISDTAGAITIPISPSIVDSGQFQTVSAKPADNAAITITGASGTVSPQGLAFHRDAFTLVTADLPVPNNVDMAARVSDKQLGISLRMIRQYDITTDLWPCRLDVLYGWAALRPELAVRVQS